MNQTDQGLWELLAATLPTLALSVAWALYRQAGPDRDGKLRLGKALVGFAWLVTAAMVHWTPPNWQPMHPLSGGLLQAIAFAAFGVVAFPLTLIEAKGAWPAKLLTALGVCLLLIPGTCFGAWVGASSTGSYGPYPP